VGLFDGQIKSFAIKFCNYLDERSTHYNGEAKKIPENPQAQLMYYTVALVLSEVSTGLKTVAEL
jgi:hypothetical protein